MSATNYNRDITDPQEPCLDGYCAEYDEVMKQQQEEARKAMETDENFEEEMKKRVF